MRIALNCPQLHTKFGDGIAAVTRNVTLNMEADHYYPFYELPYRPAALASWYAWAYTGLSAWLNINKPDVLINFDACLPLFNPSVHILYDIVPMIVKGTMTPAGTLTYRILSRDAVNRADRLVTISQNAKVEIEDYYKLKPGTVKVIKLGYDSGIFRPTHNPLVLEKYKITKRYAMFVGTLAPKKNIVRIANAFHNAGIKDMELLIIGKPYALGKVEMSFLNKPEIRQLGYVPLADLPVLLSHATMLVWPSLYEGFGLPVLEAMACGCPVITSNISSMPEVTGDAAILVNPYDVEEITESIKIVSISPALCLKLSRQGIDRAKQFSWKNTANELIKICEEVI